MSIFLSLRSMHSRQLLIFYFLVFGIGIFVNNGTIQETVPGTNTSYPYFEDKSNEKFIHLTVNDYTGHVYIGAVDKIYQLSKDLLLESSVEMGPKDDSPSCSATRNCPDIAKKPTHYWNKALVIDYPKSQLISCGSLFQGVCCVHKLDNVSIYDISSNEPVVANNATASTVAFIAIGPFKLPRMHVLYVGSSQTNNGLYRSDIPIVSSRSLDENSMFHITHQGITTGTRVLINNLERERFPITYVYGFSYKGFSYFLTHQKKFIHSSKPFISKLVRICQKDKDFYSYTEVPLVCKSPTRGDYNLAQAGYKGLPGSDLAATLGITAQDEVLYVVFAKSSEEKEVYNKPIANSSLCVFALSAVHRKFTQNIQHCFNGNGNQGLEFVNPTKKCEPTMRCNETGLYKFHGNPMVQCKHGNWDHPLPSCQHTTLHKNFSSDSPPSIIYSVTTGDIGTNDIGELVVTPGTIVHFDCIYSRSSGDPEWSWSLAKRQYPSGWAVDEDERNWKYRLSIYYANDLDSGEFKCTTPKGHSNAIRLLVKEIECTPIFSNDENRIMSVEGNKMHNRARFSCLQGYYLDGYDELICKPNGYWSNSMPKCKAIKCPVLNTNDPNLRITPYNRTFESRVYFSCPDGYRLKGPISITCLKNNTWSNKLPECEETSCVPPMPPINGRVLDSGRYLKGDYVQYVCTKGFVLLGDSLSICLENGSWSRPAPICQATCEFSGEPKNGYLIPTKFYYNIGEKINIVCVPNFHVLGSTTIICEENGHWSSPLPYCKPIHKAN